MLIFRFQTKTMMNQHRRICIVCLVVMSGLVATVIGTLIGLYFGLFASQIKPNGQNPGVRPTEKIFFDEEASLPACETAGKKRNKCVKPIIENLENVTAVGGDFPSEENIAVTKNIAGMSPLRYDLNLSFYGKRDFTGEVKILLKVVKSTTKIVINFDSANVEMNFANIRLNERCSTQIICIKKITVLPTLQLTILESTVPLTEFAYYTLTFPHFQGAVYSPETKRGSRGLFIADRMAPSWAIGTIFQMRYARTVFPCFDYPNLKAKFTFCVEHPSNFRALSNSELESSENADENRRKSSCFRKSPIMSTYVFTFSLISEMESIKSRSNSNRTALEVIFPFGEKRRLSWLLPEARWILEKLENITKTKFMLPKLDFLNLSPSPFWGIENYGLITLDYGWTSYSDYDNPHRILVHEIVHQWVGNYFTINSWSEICLQEGLTAFLEWKIGSELPSVRQKFEHKVESTIADSLRTDQAESPIIRTDFWKTQDIADRCFQKPPLGFHMLTKIFGNTIIARFLATMSQNFKFSNAGLDDWAQHFEFAAENVFAAKFMRNFFTQPGYPVLNIRSSEESDQIFVTQKIFLSRSVLPVSSEQNLYVLPLELYTSIQESPKIEFLTNISAVFSVPREKTYFFFDPTTFYGRSLYELSNYRHLLECYSLKSYQNSNCSISSSQIHSIFNDFCFGLLENQFPLSGDNIIAESWSVFFDKLYDLSSSMKRGQSTIRLPNSCQCCLATEREIKKRKGRKSCAYSWKNDCQNLRILKLLERDYYL